MELSIACNVDPKVAIIDGRRETVLGLAAFHAFPKGKGLGRAGLELLVKLAMADGYSYVIGFAEDDVVGFYKACGWSVAPNYIKSKIDGRMKRAVCWSSDGPKVRTISPQERDW